MSQDLICRDCLVRDLIIRDCLVQLKSCGYPTPGQELVRLSGILRRLVKWAVENGFHNTLEFLMQNGGVIDQNTIELAAPQGLGLVPVQLGQLECLKLFTIPSNKQGRVIEIAARYGELECLKYFHALGYPLTPHAGVEAVVNGHLPCLEYVHQNGGDMHECIYGFACEGPNQECMDYLVKNHVKDGMNGTYE